MKKLLSSSLAALALSLSAPAARAADEHAPLADVLDLDATVTSEVVPDLSVVTMAIVREGPDVAPLTKDVNDTLAKAFADAKAVPSVIAANGGYTTFPRYETRNNQSVRNGWQVRAELVLKSKDFAALGILVGRLSEKLQIDGAGFEISPELRNQESNALLDRAARAFQEKAAAGTRAFGYGGYSIRKVTLGNAGQSGSPRVMRLEAQSAKLASPMPIESGRATLSLTVSGSVQMHR